jgi:hypothetical protein
MKTNHLGTFLGDNGKTYEVLEDVSQVIHRSLDKPPKTMDGSKSYRTSCGVPVNFKKGIFMTWDDVVLKPV